MGLHQTLKFVHLKTKKKMKRQLKEQEKKYFQIKYLIKGEHPEYIQKTPTTSQDIYLVNNPIKN